MARLRRDPADPDAARELLAEAGRSGRLDEGVRRLRMLVGPEGSGSGPFLDAVRDSGYGLGDPHLQFPVPVRTAAVAPGGRHLAVLLADGTLDLHTLAVPRDLHRFHFEPGAGWLAFAADGSALGVATLGRGALRGARIELAAAPRLDPFAVEVALGGEAAVLAAARDLSTWLVADRDQALLLRPGQAPAAAVRWPASPDRLRAGWIAPDGTAAIVERQVSPLASEYLLVGPGSAACVRIHGGFEPDLAWSWSEDGRFALGTKQEDGLESEDDPWAPFPNLVPWLHVLVFDRAQGRRVGELVAEGDSRTCGFDPAGGLRLGGVPVGPDLAASPATALAGAPPPGPGAWRWDASRSLDQPEYRLDPPGSVPEAELVELTVLDPGGRVAARDDRDGVTIWRLAGAPARELELSREPRSYRALDPAGTCEVRLGTDGTLEVRALAEPTPRSRVGLPREPGEFYRALAVLPGAGEVVAFSDQGRVRRVDASGGAVRQVRVLAGGPVQRVGATPDGRFLWAVREGWEGLVVLDAAELRPRVEVASARFESRLATAAIPRLGWLVTRTDQALVAIDPEARTTRTLVRLPGRAGAMAVAPDGRELVLVREPAEPGRSPELLRLALGPEGATPLPAPAAPEGAWAPIRALAYAPDGRALLVTQGRHLRFVPLGLTGAAAP